MPFWREVHQNAEVRSVGDGGWVGGRRGPNEPWRGVRLVGERRMFSVLWLDCECAMPGSSVDGWVVWAGIGALIAMCVTWKILQSSS